MTTNPALKSFIAVDAASPFPIQNLPYGVFLPKQGEARIGIAIGEFILDARVCVEEGLLHEDSLRESTLNAFMSRGKSVWKSAREQISRLLQHDNPQLRDNTNLRDRALIPQADVEMRLPCVIGDYTDFYSSRDHATNVGEMFRGKENALLPNWLHLPVAYHGRSSSIVISGTDLHRPHGQTKADDAALPTFGPSRSVDFELEMGFLIGPGNRLGSSISCERAEDHIFGLALVNDWSARDIQKWEYVPLGPFLAKNFGTSISPWIVTMGALEPFRTKGPDQLEAQPLPYLQQSGDRTFDIQLEVLLQTPKMKTGEIISRSNFKHLYWSMAQQLAHHSVNGCNLRPGDLLASGTISGPTEDSRGSMLELAWKGTKPLELSTGETRTFLQDGDRVTLRGTCVGKEYSIGFGEVTGKILPSVFTAT